MRDTARVTAAASSSGYAWYRMCSVIFTLHAPFTQLHHVGETALHADCELRPTRSLLLRSLRHSSSLRLLAALGAGASSRRSRSARCAAPGADPSEQAARASRSSGGRLRRSARVAAGLRPPRPCCPRCGSLLLAAAARAPRRRSRSGRARGGRRGGGWLPRAAPRREAGRRREPSPAPPSAGWPAPARVSGGLDRARCCQLELPSSTRRRVAFGALACWCCCCACLLRGVSGCITR